MKSSPSEPVNVALYRLRDSADMIKDLEMGRISWFIQVGSKYPHKEVEEDQTTEEKAMGLQK